MTLKWNGIPLGVQSWCFRKFTNDQIPALLKECGVSALEICPAHLDVHAEGADSLRILERYRSHGISFNSFGIHGFPNDEEKLRPVFEFAAQAGIGVLGASPRPDSFRLVEALCSEFGVKVAIHNHGRKDQLYGKLEQLREALASASDNIGLCLDTGWMLDVGEDPAEMVRRYAGRIYGIHFKDFSYSADGNREEAVLGTGRLDLPGLVAALRESGFDGYATIEYEGEPDDPVTSIKRCIEQLNRASM